MRTINISDSIKRTKKCFEESFAEGVFYNRQTQDREQLEKIIDFLTLKDGMKILDLGTGTGYLAFAIAEMLPASEITGLDIVEKALEENRKRAAYESLYNLNFISYDGIRFPFDNQKFDLIVSRYALHHFPAVNDTFAEIGRVLKPNGILFLSDPEPNDNDTTRFVDEYMQMKKDGHIRFYTQKEWIEIAGGAGLEYEKGFKTRAPLKTDFPFSNRFLEVPFSVFFIVCM